MGFVSSFSSSSRPSCVISIVLASWGPVDGSIRFRSFSGVRCCFHLVGKRIASVVFVTRGDFVVEDGMPRSSGEKKKRNRELMVSVTFARNGVEAKEGENDNQEDEDDDEEEESHHWAAGFMSSTTAQVSPMRGTS